MNKPVMMQYFEWYLDCDCKLWKQVTKEAKHLKEVGIDSLWLPPAYKGSGGKWDVGYGAYDLYDLGEFDQKGSLETKYGSKEEYVLMAQECHKVGLKIYVDMVLNHKMGADACELVPAIKVNRQHRNQVEEEHVMVQAWTRYDYVNRHQKYSAFTWNYHHFDGVDYDDQTHTNAIYRIYGKDWDQHVSKELGNYDYLMGCDLDFQNEEVVAELTRWACWYYDMIGYDGIRFDACKHIDSHFFAPFVEVIKQKQPNLACVGEYWSDTISEQLQFLEDCHGCMRLFDVALHHHFRQASASNGYYDMRTIFKDTLTAINPDHSAPFVDNHDSQPNQALSSWVLEWFKVHAYSMILLRKEGYPVIFYGDYYGVKKDGYAGYKTIIDWLLQVRKQHMMGSSHDYFDDCDIVGWTFEGDDSHTGFACILTNACGGHKRMYIGKQYANCILYDGLCNIQNGVCVDDQGMGDFVCKDGSVSVYLFEKNCQE